MAMLKTTDTGLELLKFRNGIATDARHTSACERIILDILIEAPLAMVLAKREAIDAHGIYVCDVANELENGTCARG